LAYASSSIGNLTHLAAELFATTRDLYLWTGELPESPDDCETANGRPATREWAYDRLTRMLCADRDEISRPEIDQLVKQWIDLQQSQIQRAIEQVIARLAAPVKMVLLSGEGEFLARRVVASTPELAQAETLSLASVLGPTHSAGACAYAVARLAVERPL
jgi:uncharacterized hydantoinase/oxoprolinase family protein